MEESQTTPRPLQVGDRVRYTYPDYQYVETSINNGDVLEVVSVSKFSTEVTVHTTEFVDNENLELIELYDRKREFLTRLQSLLREFDAGISYRRDDGDWDYLELRIGDEVISREDDGEINADNIMNYEKE